jgi:hypothetical protein
MFSPVCVFVLTWKTQTSCKYQGIKACNRWETTALLAKGNTNASQMYSRVLTVTIRAHLFVPNIYVRCGLLGVCWCLNLLCVSWFSRGCWQWQFARICSDPNYNSLDQRITCNCSIYRSWQVRCFDAYNSYRATGFRSPGHSYILGDTSRTSLMFSPEGNRNYTYFFFTLCNAKIFKSCTFCFQMGWYHAAHWFRWKQIL